MKTCSELRFRSWWSFALPPAFNPSTHFQIFVPNFPIRHDNSLEFQPLFWTLLLHTDPTSSHRPTLPLRISGRDPWGGNLLCPITSYDFADKHWPVQTSTSLSHPCLVPPQNSSALEAPYHSFTPIRDPGIQFHTRTRVSPYCPHITVSSLVQFQFLLILVSVPVPCSNCLLCCPCCTHRFPVSNLYSNLFLFLWLCSLTRIYRPHLYYIWYVRISLWLLFSLSTQPLVTSDIHPLP